MMVESEIKELNEDEVLGGVMFAHAAIQPVIDAIIELAEHSAKEPFDFAVDDTDAVKAEVKKLIGEDLAAAFKIVAKGERHDAVDAARKAKALAKLGKSDANPTGIDADQVRRRLQGTGSRRRAPQHPRHRHPHRRAHGRQGPPDRLGSRRAAAAPTARRCSPAARPRPWWSPRSAPATTSS